MHAGSKGKSPTGRVNPRDLHANARSKGLLTRDSVKHLAGYPASTLNHLRATQVPARGSPLMSARFVFQAPHSRFYHSG